MKERFAIVTGSTKGIGKEIGCLLLSKGFSVIFNYAEDEEAASQLEGELKKEYEGRFYIIHQRLETEADIESFYDSCVEITKTVEILVLNAACTDRTSWKEMTWAQWERVMNVNLNAPAAIVRKFDNHIEQMGNIVFIGAILGIYAHAVSIPYSVSKAGVHGLTKALVKEYCERGIRVNAVIPGFVETPWQKDKAADHRERICQKISLHRFATTVEIAEIVWNVIDSSYINGALIEADGGYCYK
ncbi:MAG: SDR family oxidoreductase [Lachnospiraceae bacterium]|nr:SDR family oxidoreductase [Lachnospiraceae bacterium]